MSKISHLFGVSAAAAALALFAFGAQAQQQKAPEKAAPAKAAPAKAPPKCKALKQQADCEGRTDCKWTAASIDAKTKKQKKAAYCSAMPKPKAAPKKAEPKKDAPKK